MGSVSCVYENTAMKQLMGSRANQSSTRSTATLVVDAIKILEQL